MSLHDTSITIAQLAALLVGLGIIGRSSRAAYRFIKRLDTMHDVVVRELLPNGGSSLRDAINRIDRHAATVDSTVSSIDERVATVEGILDRRDPDTERRDT